MSFDINADIQKAIRDSQRLIEKENDYGRRKENKKAYLACEVEIGCDKWNTNIGFRIFRKSFTQQAE
jgi:hypothetical protein